MLCGRTKEGNTVQTSSPFGASLIRTVYALLRTRVDSRAVYIYNRK